MPHKSFYHRLPTDSSVQAYQTFLKDSAQLFGAASPGINHTKNFVQKEDF